MDFTPPDAVAASFASFPTASDGLEQMFRMPTIFGPSAGPRNVPASQQRFRYANDRTQITIDALTDAAAVSAYLPPGCRLVGDPVLRVSVSCLTRLGWLAGRGYNIVTVQFANVVFDAKDGPLYGTFDAVLWESLCDPIITGREEIAIPKLFADIPNIRTFGANCAGSASWDGFRFFDMTVSDLTEATEPRPRLQPRMSYKYMPRTGEWGRADVGYMTTAAPDPKSPPAELRTYRVGKGSFKFYPATWEDMPTQYHVVTALAGLPLREFLHSELAITSQGETETVGDGSGGSQRVVA